MTHIRSNHFKDWISQYRKNPNIPQDVIHQVQTMLVQREQSVTPKAVLTVLKELHLSTMYEHKGLISDLINGVPTPFLTIDQESQVLLLFEELLPLMNNSIHYGYITYQLLKLIGMPEQVYSQFQIGRINHDANWREMMVQLDERKALNRSWPFYPTK